MSNPTARRVPRRLNHEPESVQWARKRTGYTQAALAEAAGISRTLLVEIEAGTRNATPDNLNKLARALNCPVALLERKRDEPEETASTPRHLRELRDGERADAPSVPDLRGAAVAPGGRD